MSPCLCGTPSRRLPAVLEASRNDDVEPGGTMSDSTGAPVTTCDDSKKICREMLGAILLDFG